MTAVYIGGYPVPVYPEIVDLPPSAPYGSLAVVLANNSLYEFSDPAGTWVLIGPSGSSGAGTVTSVGVADTSAAPIYSVSGSPVTTSGTIDLTLVSKPINTVFAGPVSGSAGQPAFRSLVAADLPAGVAFYSVSEFTLSSTNMGNKYVTLPSAPANPTLTVLTVIGGPVQDYGVDYMISGSTLSWSGLFLDGVLAIGDVLIVQTY